MDGNAYAAGDAKDTSKFTDAIDVTESTMSLAESMIGHSYITRLWLIYLIVIFLT